MQFHEYVLHLYFEIHLFPNDVSIYPIYIIFHFSKDNDELILIYFDNDDIHEKVDLLE